MRSARTLAPFLAVSWVGAAGLCLHYDLAISRSWVDPRAGWAVFGERYGTLPGVYVLAIAAALSYAKPKQPAPRTRLADGSLWLLCSICTALAVAVSSYRLGGYRFSALEGLATCAAVAVLARWARPLWATKVSLGRRLEQACRWTLLLGVSSWLIVYAIKLVWGRVRYRDLDTLASAFTPWYLPQGLTGHTSFPSGHAAMGWMLLPCLMLWPRGSLAHGVAAFISITWGFFVAASRVVVGAHYASDVLFSSAFAITVMAFAQASGAPVIGDVASSSRKLAQTSADRGPVARPDREVVRQTSPRTP